MKLFEVIKKEISVVKSQKIAILLIVLYPLLAIGLLGMGLTSSAAETFSNAKIGIYDNLPYELDIENELFGENSTATVINYENQDDLILGVKKKEVIVGLGLNAKNEKSQILVDLYYDNSNIAAGTTFKEFAKITMNSFALKQTRNQLSQVWSIISELGTNMDNELQQINDFKQKLNDAEESLDSLEEKVNQIDFDEIEGTLDSQKTTIDSFEQKNQDFKEELASFKSSFDDLKTQIKDLNAIFNNYSFEANLLSTQLDDEIKNIDELLEKDLGEEAEELLLSQRDKLVDSKKKVDLLNENIKQLNESNSELNSKIKKADALFIKFEKESGNITNTLQSSNQSIESMNTKLSVFKESINEVKEMISSARKSRIEILGKLDSSSALMSNLSEQIIDFSKIDIDVLSQPLRIYERRLFQPQSFFLALFPIDPLIIGGITANAVSIVLILTCLLLTSIIVILERNEKVSLRMSLSSTNKSIFLTGKIIGQLLIALLEASIIFFVAMFVFGINLLPNIVLIYFATILVSVAFISLGLLISSFTKTQSTAILLSLLAVVPMLFLSGIILPLDLMNPLMQLVSTFLPLTAANNLLIGLIVKGLFITDLMVEVSVLVMIILLGVLAFMLRDKY